MSAQSNPMENKQSCLPQSRRGVVDLLPETARLLSFQNASRMLKCLLSDCALFFLLRFLTEFFVALQATKDCIDVTVILGCCMVIKIQ